MARVFKVGSYCHILYEAPICEDPGAGQGVCWNRQALSSPLGDLEIHFCFEF